MVGNKSTWRDAFDLMCHDKLGGGIHRETFVFRFDHTRVVKVEIDGDWRFFANAREMQFWNDHEHVKSVSRWLAPCHYLSPNGRVMIQSRVQPIRDGDKLPARIPAFLADIKRENFGWLNGRLVCCDYATVLTNQRAGMRKADWD